jgi:hypothetical protein
MEQLIHLIKYHYVYLSVRCHAVFRHYLPHAKYYRDFPFGEEETLINQIYPNTYTRITDDKHGFTLIHNGIQRAEIVRYPQAGEIKHLVARDKVFGDYEWNFILYFGQHSSWESAKLAKVENAFIPAISSHEEVQCSFIHIAQDQVLLSAIYHEEDLMVRLVNYSNRVLSQVYITVDQVYEEAFQQDFCGNKISTLCLEYEKSLQTKGSVGFQPWEIVTIKYKK